MPGERLNKPCYITFKNFFGGEKRIVPSKLLTNMAMKEASRMPNLEFVGYNHEKNEVKLRADYFE